MRVIGLDYGDKRIGAAVSDPLQKIAFGAQVIENRNVEFVVDKLNEMIDKYGDVEEIVIGLPYNLKGGHSEQTKKTEDFFNKIKGKLKIGIKMVDERLSTIESGRKLREAGLNSKTMKGRIDEASAMNILQNYLDSKKWH